MDEQQQVRRRLILKRVIWTVCILVALAVAIALAYSIYRGYRHGFNWTGMVKDPDFNKRTLWDWLDLLIVPVVLAVGGFLFTRSENRRTQDIANQRAQDAALQAYLDKMSELLIDEELHKKADRYHPTRVTARARTLAVLRELDSGRKRTVLLFLRESRLINSKVRCRNGRVAAYARLVGLRDADLKYANLRGAKLINARRDEPVSLEGATLIGADLQAADLKGADLKGADLRKAKLKKAVLRDAHLSGANLKGASGVTNDELDEFADSLQGATMPNGQKYEDWLKSKGHREDGQNYGPS